MTDYWLSKMMFDLQKSPDETAKWRADRVQMLDRYPLDPAVRKAVLEDDLTVLAPRVNAYLLRFYVGICGMPDPEFIRRLQALKPGGTAAHG